MSSYDTFTPWHLYHAGEMDGLALFSVSWLRNIAAIISILWIAYRCYQVCVKPADELMNLLGLEMPVPPEVSLSRIRSDAVELHIKPSDSPGLAEELQIWVNGITVGSVSPQDGSIIICNLKPDNYYCIRVVAVNALKFMATSAALRLQTRPAASDDFYDKPSWDELASTLGGEECLPPAIKPFTATPVPNPPPMTREHSNSQSQGKRGGPGRRPSPASLGLELPADAAEDASKNAETVSQLQEKLQSLRRENEDIERQIGEEEDQFNAIRTSLMQDRERYRQELKGKEETTRELKREVANLERQNTTAQNRKSNLEKQLHQKLNERKKMVDDMERWGREMEEFRTDIERTEQEKAVSGEQTERRIAELREALVQGQNTNKTVEEGIREKGTLIKLLEEERRNLQLVDEEARVNGDSTTAGPDREWEQKLQSLQVRYVAAWNSMQSAEQMCREAQAQLKLLQQRRASQSHIFSSVPPLEGPPGRRSSQHRRRTGSLLNDTGSSIFPKSSAAPFNSSVSSISPTFSTSTPFLNINNGMTLPPPSQSTTLSAPDTEILIAGAPMSPTAGALLPSDLFNNEADHPGNVIEVGGSPGSAGEPPLGSVGDPPLGSKILPGLGAPKTLEQSNQSPSSPVSVQSRSPSVFASPRDSSSHLVLLQKSDTFIDSDKASIRSASSSLRAVSGGGSSTTRWAQMFGINRQRGKTMSDDGPRLGTLKPSQSHSLPRQDIADLDPIGSHRRRGSHSGSSWMTSMSSAFRLNSAAVKRDQENSGSNPSHIATRRRAFNMFGSKGEPWVSGFGDRPSSPRPGSTKSIESNLLPRPSTETQQRFGWPVGNLPQRSNTLGADWNSRLHSTTPWSRHPSRRPSVQHSTSNGLSVDGTLSLDDFSTLAVSPPQAPIGTRPQSAQSTTHLRASAGLNPTAPSFKTLFSLPKKGDKAERTLDKNAEKAEKSAEKKVEKASKTEKGKSKDKDRDAASDTPLIGSSSKDIFSISPNDSRKSKDARSVSTLATDSLYGPSPRSSLDRTLSQTLSESVPSTPNPNRETFMQKLSRKSSSSRFNIPGFGGGKDKSERSGLFGKKSAASETAEESAVDDGGANFSGIARSVDSISASASPSIGSISGKDRSSVLSWSGLKRMGKKGDKTPSLHESVTSEADEEDAGETDLATGIGLIV